MGHEDPFPPRRPNDGYVIRRETVAWARGSRRDAPIDPMGVRIATGALQSEVAKPTHSGDDHAGCS